MAILFVPTSTFCVLIYSPLQTGTLLFTSSVLTKCVIIDVGSSSLSLYLSKRSSTSQLWVLFGTVGPLAIVSSGSPITSDSIRATSCKDTSQQGKGPIKQLYLGRVSCLS